MATVRFLEDDRFGLWRAGEEAEDLGPESPQSRALRVIRLADGQFITLTLPYSRGIIEPVSADGSH
jgi:hypothetical protein